MKKATLFFITVPIFLILNSCLLKKNNDYAMNYNSMDTIEFSKKYYTLYRSTGVVSSNIKIDQPYYILGNNATAQVIIFSNDKFIYESPSIPFSSLNKPFPVTKLGRRSYYITENDVIKTESIATSVGNIHTVIEEGKIGTDTIVMKKSYNTKGARNEQPLFKEYIPIKGIKAYKLGDDYFIESK